MKKGDFVKETEKQKGIRWFLMITILIIEDQEDVNLMLAEALTYAGYKVKSSFTGVDGIKEIQNNSYDLILLDIMLPYKSGDEILKEMRNFSETPVIVISAKDMVGTKIDLLKLGADDYITKPFDLGEVVARVESNLRRSQKQIQGSKIFQYKDLALDDNTKRVTVDEIEMELTAKEYMILELLVKHAGKVFTKSNLYESVWKDEYLGDDNAVKTHISNLRNKLKKANRNEDYIETVWGLGYRLYRE
ncbi:response regulator transcription factor [Paenibacillus sophorae]|nr:response regulator transcription factor [Paenibacillus sophorae]